MHRGRTLKRLGVAVAGVLALVAAGARPVAAAAGAGRSAGASVARLDSVVRAGIEDGASPGAAVAIGHAGGGVVIRTYGRTDWSPTAPAVTDSTLYDLASLTKVMAATPAAMLLVQQGRLDLDAALWRYLPYWPRTGGKGRITIRDLLLHRAGFPAGEALRGADREARLESVAWRPLAYAPGTRTVYSDISMVVLDAVIERVTGERLDRFVTDHVFAPLELRDTRYTPRHPLEANPFDLALIAATEGRGAGQIHGVVSDPIARELDGVSGNAGLFSSIRDVARYAQLILAGAEGLQTPVLSDSVIRLFTTRAPGSRRALGWEGPTGGTLWAPYFSDASFGHTGYTGTSIWIDPVRDVFVVLLTNRVDPTAANEKHVALRRAVNEVVADRFVGASPEYAGTGALASLSDALFRAVPFRDPANPAALDSAAVPPAWLAPAEEDVLALGTGRGSDLAVILLLVLGAGAVLANQPAGSRRRR